MEGRLKRKGDNMEKEKMINILMADRCSKKEAERFIEKGASIYEEKDVQDLIKDFGNEFTAQDIKDGNVEDISCVQYDGKKYYITYVI